MVEHFKHAMIVELPRDVTVLTSMQPMPMLKYYNNLNNRMLHHRTQAHPTTLLSNLIHHHLHQFHHPNNLTHSSTLLFLQRTITTWSRFIQNGVQYSLKAVMGVSGSGLTLGFDRLRLETISVKIVESQDHNSTRTTTCIQGQVALIFPHSLRLRKCLSHLFMH